MAVIKNPLTSRKQIAGFIQSQTIIHDMGPQHGPASVARIEAQSKNAKAELDRIATADADSPYAKKEKK